MLVRINDPHEESLETTLNKYFAVKIRLKDTSNAIERLNEVFPMDHIRHLKRIRKLKGEDHVTALAYEIFDANEDVETFEIKLKGSEIPYEAITTVQVPVRKPITKKQYQAWNLIWPLVFHESMDEKIKLKQYMLNSAIFQKFEPYFRRNSLSLMIVEAIENCDDSKIIEDLIIYENYCTDIKCNSSEPSYPFDHYVLQSLTGTAKNQRVTRNGKIPYLLSGCVAILSHEPCTLCSMALLHSRIDSIIYLNRCESSGALGSLYFLHSMDSLNHRFPVYKLHN